MTDRMVTKVLLVALVCFVLGLPGYSQSNTPPAGQQRSPQTTIPPQPADRTGDRTTDRTADRTEHDNKSANTPIMKAIEMNVAEVEAGKMASGKAENPRVKEFADMMVKDHTDALTKLRAVQGAPSDVKPNTKHQQTADRLSKLSGAAFDREYMRVMVSDHQGALKFFEQQSAQKGTDFSKVAEELRPTVRQHLQQAQEIQKELQGGSKPTKQSSTAPDTSKRPPNPDQK